MLPGTCTVVEDEQKSGEWAADMIGRQKLRKPRYLEVEGPLDLPVTYPIPARYYLSTYNRRDICLFFVGILHLI
jgi:hypothetical protein